MHTHQFFENGKHSILLSLLDIISYSFDKFKLHLAESILGDLAVDSDLEGVVGVLFNAVPLNNVGVDLVDDLQHSLAVADVLKQVFDDDSIDF